MHRTQIYLTDEERKALRVIARRLRKTQSQVIRTAVDRFIERHIGPQRLESLRHARGLWKDRRDLPDFTKIRRELDRLTTRNG
jgi:hypothetical protein